jgi:hypothetical protein
MMKLFNFRAVLAVFAVLTKHTGGRFLGIRNSSERCKYRVVSRRISLFQT